MSEGREQPATDGAMAVAEKAKHCAPGKVLEVDGAGLSLKDLQLFIEDETTVVRVTDGSLKATDVSRSFLEREMRDKIIYGVNTGFGPMASHIINHDELARLQKNLILSHAVGMGTPVDWRFVAAAMLVRLNTLAKGFSAVSPALLERLQIFINRRILPVIPEHGAVGTSGDLVQLAHIGLALLGEGDVWYRKALRPAREVLEELGFRPYELKPKEGLSLINGTSFMAGVGAMVSIRAERLLNIAVRLGALSLEITQGFDDYIAKRLNDLRPHDGQRFIAKQLRILLESSRLIRKRDELPRLVNGAGPPYTVQDEVQSVYSLRCIPQIVGPVADTLKRTKIIVEIEMNSVTDNPIVDSAGGVVLHGGNFHGDVVAGALDDLKARLVKLILLSERRINFFLHRGINKRFPPFLNLRQPGLTLGLQGLQFVATSTAAQSQTLAFPQSVHSIPTNADNQDVVSMGADAALLTAKVIENAFVVLAIEAIVLAQAVEAEGVADKLSLSSSQIFEEIQKVFPPVYEDRDLSKDLPAVVELLEAGECFTP
ncbi:aromatic amino acid lyase [Candidatus Wolfebacteria bacterium]|nr:aromatic amino acid lyase [Candidatus Wolfebacteria bacterium]